MGVGHLETELSTKDVQVKPWPGVGITWGAFNTRPSPTPTPAPKALATPLTN